MHVLLNRTSVNLGESINLWTLITYLKIIDFDIKHMMTYERNLKHNKLNWLQ